MPPWRMPESFRWKGLTLRVRAMDPMRRFYQDLLGLEVVATNTPGVLLRPAGSTFSLTLVHEPTAPLRPYPCVGLYHFALLLPSRPALAGILRRLVDAGYPLEGAADHRVSEALYLRDPEGNGMELYRDRPREAWTFHQGELRMGTDPLDLDNLLAEADRADDLHPETTLGHLHVHVANLDPAGQFFEETLGFEVTSRRYPGARFLSAGGYHHHMGLNTWAGSLVAPNGTTGMIHYTAVLSDHDLSRFVDHLDQRKASYISEGNQVILLDPCGHQLQVSAKPPNVTSASSAPAS